MFLVMYDRNQLLVDLLEVASFDKAIQTIKELLFRIKTFEISNDRISIKGSITEDYRIHLSGFPEVS